MKSGEFANVLACMADAEARSTAMLVEVLAATVLAKLNPPDADSVVELEIKQGDLSAAGVEFVWITEYDEHGTMKMRLSRKLESLALAQPDEEAEVTSDAD